MTKSYVEKSEAKILVKRLLAGDKIRVPPMYESHIYRIIDVIEENLSNRKTGGNYASEVTEEDDFITLQLGYRGKIKFEVKWNNWDTIWEKSDE
jgi:hypothetical protein